MGKKKREKYFEVSGGVSAWLTGALWVSLVALVLDHWASCFGPTGGGYGGMVGRWASELMYSGFGGGLVRLLGGVATVLMLEWLRRSVRRAGSQAWTLVALWEVLVGSAAVVAAIPGSDPLYAYAHVPTVWDTFRETFLQNERVVSGCVQLAVAVMAMVRFGGRVFLYGLSLVACPLVSAALMAALMPLWERGGGVGTTLALGWQSFDLLMDAIPLVLLRLSMRARVIVGEAEGDSDVR